jgi:hypothetical protein
VAAALALLVAARDKEWRACTRGQRRLLGAVSSPLQDLEPTARARLYYGLRHVRIPLCSHETSQLARVKRLDDASHQ